MSVRRLERRLRELEQRQEAERREGERRWMLKYIQEAAGDDELCTLMRPAAEAQAYHGFDSPEADAAYEKVKDEFMRILEERYSWVFENLEQEVPRLE